MWILARLGKLFCQFPVTCTWQDSGNGMTGPPLIPARGLVRFKGAVPWLEFPAWGVSYTQSSSMHQSLAGFVACLREFRMCSLYRTAESRQLSFWTEIVFIRFFFGSIQDCVSEILSIIKNMTWIYYGSQLQFLNTLVRLVSNIFPSQEVKKGENIRLSFLGGRGGGMWVRPCQNRWAQKGPKCFW